MASMLRDITDVRHEGGHRVWLRFNDGAEGVVDLATALKFVGVLAPLRDESYFAKVRVDPQSRMLAWPNGVDLDPDVLYSRLTGAPLPGSAGWRRPEGFARKSEVAVDPPRRGATRCGVRRHLNLGDTDMKYLCLAYGDQKKMEKLTKDEFAALVERAKTYDAELQATGQVVQAGSLEWDYVALRPGGAQPIVSDGPFVETKEKVGGVIVIEARDLNDAIRVASLHPAARMGEQLGWWIELRPYAAGCHQ
jgi:hypothetical protein